MAPSRRQSNGRSPIVNQQSQITAFFSKASSQSPSPSLAISKPNFKSNSNPSSSPSTSPTTPSPLQSKRKKPLLVIDSSTALTITKKTYGQEVVDKRIKVYWPLDQSWYEGRVKSFNEQSGQHLVQYDDADEELLVLEEEKIEWVEESVTKFKRLRRKLVIEKAIEDDESGGDDSADEDWGKNERIEAVEEVEEDLDLEDDDDGVDNCKRSKRSNSKSRKRKVSGDGKLGSGKKSKGSGVDGKMGSKASLIGNGGGLMHSNDKLESK